MADRPDYIAANREAWNEVAPRHGARNQARLIEQFRAGGCNLLEDEARAMVLETGIAGKSVVQVCCNNGKDLLSVKGMGAGRCLGIDLSDAFLAQARELAEAAGFTDDVRFLEADVYALPVELAGSFDVALTTIGVLTWMPDLPVFFGAVAGLLKPGGWWVMEETHPVVFMYEEDPDGGIPQLTYSYFRGGPERWDDGLDYFSGETYA
ncbi:MAG TPA: class I SAM-dependent methyltransferase, partial [Thermohalobaculum sp.]|nr:class I SAM-dependent methyltransferase [Thermohalobaculum sp.]